MKKVLSISLGSSSRNHKVEIKILGEKFIIERRGTDGDKKKAKKLFEELDGRYDAFGMGGIDLSIYIAGKKYFFKDAEKLISNVSKTPVVDGSGLKNTLERKVIDYMQNEMGINFSDKKVLMVSALDRFGMAEAFADNGSQIIYGDLIFALGLPLPIKSIKTLEKIARVVAPLVTRLPFQFVYPTGKKQESYSKNNKFKKYYDDVDIIAGDFHFIKKYMPADLSKKIIVTNTVTESDVKDLEEKGLKKLVTTTPELNGRSFGTNVMEAVLIALAGKKPGEMTTNEYLHLLEKINFTPRVVDFDRNLAS
ncbi:MAG: quinate 5-dehydrogenase [Bacillota bacterium]